MVRGLRGFLNAIIDYLSIGNGPIAAHHRRLTVPASRAPVEALLPGTSPFV